MGKLLIRVQGMQLHGLIKSKLLMTEKGNSVLNVQASLSPVHKHQLDSSTGKDKVTKDHTGAPLATRCFSVGSPGGYGHAGASAAGSSLLPLPPGLLGPGAVDCSQGRQHRDAEWELHQAAKHPTVQPHHLRKVPRCCKSLSSSAMCGSKDSSPCCLSSFSVHKGGDRQ